MTVLAEKSSSLRKLAALLFCGVVSMNSIIGIGAAQDKNKDKDPDAIPQAKREEVKFDESLMNESPFDLVIIKKDSGGQQVRVSIIDFPGRKKPTSPDPNSKLIVTMVKYPDRKYEVKWKDIEDVLTFEEMVLRDAKRLMEEKEYAAAFEHLNYLEVNHPSTPGLEKLREDFLFNSATSMNEQQKLPHTLAVLEELQRTFPNSRRSVQIRNAISRVTQQLIQKYVDSGDLRAAQMFVARLKKDYADNPLDSVAFWEKHFREQAESLRDQVMKCIAEENFRDARKFAGSMLAVDPSLEGGKELVQETIDRYPMIRVGVFQQSDHPDPTSLTDWASRRSGGLTSRSLFEFQMTGPEGGRYDSPLGSFTQSDDRRLLEVTFDKKNLPVQAADVAQWMLRRANPKSQDYNSSWAAIVREISLDGPDRLIVQLRQPHVLPHALLQWSLNDFVPDAGNKGLGAYRIVKNSDEENSFLWTGKDRPTNGKPVEFVERRYEDARKAVSDLVRGEIEVIDQLYPSDAVLLNGVPGIQVSNYALPTVHMLVPRSSHPYLKQVDFRRALMYSINREQVLNGELLGGRFDTDSQLVSGPFPIGKSENDALSYAYNSSVANLPFDQGLGALLVKMTEKKLSFMAAKKKEPPPPLEKIRLAVPDVEAARIAGEAFVQQWNLLKIPAEMVVLPPGVTDCTAEQADLLYVAVAVWEPATDAERLFGQDGIAATDDPYIVLALGQLRASRNWSEVRQSLQDLHRLVERHLPIMPLWQLTDAMAYRKSIQGIAPKPMTLYQGLDQWRIKEAK